MSIVVITPPQPIVTPADVPAAAGMGEDAVKAMIQAATEEIDGPTGWVGRCFGPQTLEMRACVWPFLLRLPYPPKIQITKITYVDPDGAEQELPITDPILYDNLPPVRGREGDVRIQYRAGYDGETTGPVPERARQAIILSVQHLISLNARDLALRTEDVDGVGSLTYTVSESAVAVVRQMTERLLGGLRVYQ